MKVAIVGFAETRKQAPYDDESFEIWTLNDMEVPRETRRFELHSQENINNFATRTSGENYRDFLRQRKVPVYMQKHNEDISESVEYPLDDYLKKYRDYFTNTISYMICMAIDEGYNEIHIYGVDMAQNTEYSEQRPSCEYWIGYAEAKGIKVYVPPESDLLKQAYRYGYEDDTTMKTKLSSRQAELQGRIDNLDITKEQIIEQIITEALKTELREFAIKAKQNLNQLTFEKIFLKGCLDENKYIKGVFY